MQAGIYLVHFVRYLEVKLPFQDLVLYILLLECKEVNLRSIVYFLFTHSALYFSHNTVYYKD